MPLPFITLIGVGGPHWPTVGPGWDLWPLAGIAVVLWVGRRILDMPWRPPLLIAAFAAGLVMPIAIHRWGVTFTAGAILAISLVGRALRRSGAERRNPSV